LVVEFNKKENKMQLTSILEVGCLKNAITDACRELQKRPDDSIQDIFNEAFAKWELPLRVDHISISNGRRGNETPR
jgi:hypothetical protein